MKISATASGGFAGITENYVIDTADQPPPPELKNLLDAVDFLNVDSSVPQQTTGADMRHWEITLTDEKQHHTVTFIEDGSPETADWQKLVATIRNADNSQCN